MQTVHVALWLTLCFMRNAVEQGGGSKQQQVQYHKRQQVASLLSKFDGDDDEGPIITAGPAIPAAILAANQTPPAFTSNASNAPAKNKRADGQQRESGKSGANATGAKRK